MFGGPYFHDTAATEIAEAVRLALLPALVAAGAAVVGHQAGHRTLLRGDSYLYTDGNPLTFAKSPGAQWPPDLTGWALSFTARKTVDCPAAGSASITSVGSIVTAAGDGQEVRFDLAAVDTALLAVWSHGYEYDVQAAKGDSRVTLETGTLTVKADQTLT